MRDYSELVSELRESAEWADRLAVLMGRDVGDSKAPLMRKAADAIEELKFENEIINDGIDDLKAEVKRLEEVRDKALKRICDWCGVCPEEKRDPLDCDDIAMLREAREDEE